MPNSSFQLNGKCENAAVLCKWFWSIPFGGALSGVLGRSSFTE